MARILIAKVGTDAHDMGVTIVSRWLSDAGHEVSNIGLYNTPERIADAARAFKPDVIGLSFLGGEPVLLSGRVLEALEGKGLGATALVVGGVLTPDMKEELRALGVKAIFTPGAARDSILEGINHVVAGAGRNAPAQAAARNPAAPASSV
jgi:methylmalonyl-CoA mutase C-terminal domain/subunit